LAEFIFYSIRVVDFERWWLLIDCFGEIHLFYYSPIWGDYLLPRRVSKALKKN
jgi:hypothetical protein